MMKSQTTTEEEDRTELIWAGAEIIACTAILFFMHIIITV